MKYSKIYDYEILKELGEGSFGKVYKAIRKSDGQVIALKIIDITPSNEHLIDVTQNEIETLKNLSNPACNPFVICYYDSFYDSDQKQFLIEMELIDGKEMFDYVLDYHNTKPYSIDTWYYYILLIAKDLVNGIKYNNAKGIIHNDIKLENIMIEKDTFLPKIIDYGLACNIQNSAVWNKYCKTNGGTPGYIAPEYVNHGIRLPESDLWALGVLLFISATGTMPFNKSTFRQTLNSIRDDRIVLDTDNELLNTIVNGLLIKNYRNRLSLEKLEKLLKNIPLPHSENNLNQSNQVNQSNQNNQINQNNLNLTSDPKTQGNDINLTTERQGELKWLKSFDYEGKETPIGYVDANQKKIDMFNSLFLI